MRRLRLIAVCTIAVTAGTAAPHAVQQDLDLTAIDQAMMLGRTAVATERTRLHASYRLPVGKAPVDYVEIVTPFRRVVLAAQSRAARGERALAQREALELLANAPDQLDVYVEMTFHPFNTFIGVPEYAVLLVPRTGRPVAPRATARVPRAGPRLESLPPALPAALDSGSPVNRAPLSGGTLIAQFDLNALELSAAYDVVVREGETERGRVGVDLARLR
jgi:hypothetical protein